MILVVGLGNPGAKYENNRHNIGFKLIDFLITELNALDVSKNSFEGESYKSSSFLLLKPTTFMNLSGKSVVKVKNFYKINKVIVVHDDLDLPFGALRFKEGGGHGGHNGLKSIDQYIGNNYIRVRMGIGKPQFKGEVITHVLGNFSSDETKYLNEWIKKTAKSIVAFTNKSLNDVSAQFSQKRIIVD